VLPFSVALKISWPKEICGVLMDFLTSSKWPKNDAKFDNTLHIILNIDHNNKKPINISFPTVLRLIFLSSIEDVTVKELDEAIIGLCSVSTSVIFISARPFATNLQLMSASKEYSNIVLTSLELVYIN
jgi:hypothetical protein